ncbi:glucosaminidase domain-containing protein [Enterococcus asini]|uniref:glucosaminidase domain-containing protein n=1 Tax=Enterococcus asini TaxID=57732 RepID=UPI00288DAC64|nr:glucosaminidase domain-containing protein [Enterococcus asini]MDT2757071.1 glucosaminidase domain-containing protein [Enterococcus asini]
MKKKNSLRLRKALASFSVVLILFSHGTGAYASVSQGEGNNSSQVTTTTGDSPVVQEDTSTEAIGDVSSAAPVEEVAPPEVVPEETPTESNPVVEEPSVEEPGAESPAPTPDPGEETPEVPTVNDSELQNQLAALNVALENSANYTSISFDQGALEALANEATALLANDQATQDQLDACAVTIANKLASLVLRGDKSELTKLVEQAKQLKAADYTPESFAKVKDWLQKAETILKNQDATAADLAPITAGLQEAIAGLSKAPEKNKPEKPTPPAVTPEKPAPTNPTPVEKAPETSTDSADNSTKGPSEITSGDDSVNEIDDKYGVDSLTDSNLNGYELPLLSSYDDERQGALVAQALKTLSLPYSEENGKMDKEGLPESFSNLGLTRYIYQTVLGVDLGDSYKSQATGGEKCELEKAEIGDLLFWEKDGQPTKVGLYLGQGKYLMVDSQIIPQQVTLDKDAQDEADKEKPAVAIYTIQGYAEDKEGKVTIEKEATTTTLSAAVTNPTYAVHSLGNTKLTAKGQDLLKNYAASVEFKANANTQAFIDQIGEDARELGLKYDVYASVMIAQAILESGSGSSGLSRAPYYNLFGIKGTYNGNGVVMNTMEDNGQGSLFAINASFRKYPNAKASLQDYVSLIRGGAAGSQSFYKATWRSEAKNYLQATEYLTGRYATDTQYNNKLNSLIAAYHLTQYDEPKATDAGMIIADTNQIPAQYRTQMKYPAYNGTNYNSSGSYPVGQCTWYVFNRISQLGGHVDDFMGNGGEWGQKGAQLGYRTTQTPTVGYAVSFHPGVAGSSSLYGHVAFVEAVGPDGILVSEGNVVGPLVVSYRVIPNSIARSNLVTYVAPK